jgi:hypothetical protein
MGGIIMTKKLTEFSVVFLYDAILLNNINVITDIKNKLDKIYNENVNPIINQIPNEIINIILTKENLQITILNKQLIIAKHNPLDEIVDLKYFDICEQIFDSIKINAHTPKAYGLNFTYEITNLPHLAEYLNKFGNDQININQIEFSYNHLNNIKYNLFNLKNEKIIINTNVHTDLNTTDTITNTILQENYNSTKTQIESIIDLEFENSE